jgi:hypothetical protein
MIARSARPEMRADADDGHRFWVMVRRNLPRIVHISGPVRTN